MVIFQYILAILPTLLLSWFIYRADRYEREKWLPLTLCFLAGMLVTYPVNRVQAGFADAGFDDSSNWGSALFTAFIVVALAEELFKFLLIYLFPYQQAFFDDPMDGIVYAVMIGMGFATLENLLYALRFDIPTTALRGLTAVPVHAICATIMGYYFSKAKFTHPTRPWRSLLLGLGGATLVHGLYDFFILQEIYDGLILLAIVTMIISLAFAARLLQAEQAESSAYWDRKRKQPPEP